MVLWNRTNCIVSSSWILLQLLIVFCSVMELSIITSRVKALLMSDGSVSLQNTPHPHACVISWVARQIPGEAAVIVWQCVGGFAWQYILALMKLSRLCCSSSYRRLQAQWGGQSVSGWGEHRGLSRKAEYCRLFYGGAVGLHGGEQDFNGIFRRKMGADFCSLVNQPLPSAFSSLISSTLLSSFSTWNLPPPVLTCVFCV